MFTFYLATIYRQLDRNVFCHIFVTCPYITRIFSARIENSPRVVKSRQVCLGLIKTSYFHAISGKM